MDRVVNSGDGHEPVATSRSPALRYVECPRDAWQGLPGVIPTAVKANHARRLLAAGFADLDLGSFVSARAVPQWADSEAMLALIDRPPQADLLCIVGNERGLQRAGAAPGVTSVGFPFSVNDRFQRRNLGRSVSESWPLLERMQQESVRLGLRLVVYVSMGFGNPYGDPWRPLDTAAIVERLRRLGITDIALADTAGTADRDRVLAVLAVVPDPSHLGLHLHARPGAWQALLEAALGSGVRWIEGALGGIGGCPFAGDTLVGNLPTEHVLPWLAAQGFDVGPSGETLLACAEEAAAIADRYGAEQVQVKPG